MIHDETETPKYRLAITLPHLSQKELFALLNACDAKQDTFPHFCDWISQLIQDELTRREMDGAEAEMVEVPSFTGDQFANVLAGSFVFSRLPFNDNQHRFLDDVALRLNAAAVGIIQFHLSGVPV